MKRLLRLTVILAAFIFVMVNAARLIGSTRPTSKAVQYWHLADCAPPCWAGITPNETSPRDAKERISRLFTSLPMTSRSDGYWVWQSNDYALGAYSNIVLWITQGNVFAIALNFVFLLETNETIVTLGDLVAVLGSPDCIDIEAITGYPALHYTNTSGQDVVEIIVSELQLTTPVTSVWMGFADIGCQKLPPNVHAIPWRGFRSYELYLADVANRK